MKFVPRANRKASNPQLSAEQVPVTATDAVLMGPQATKSLVQLNAELHLTSHHDEQQGAPTMRETGKFCHVAVGAMKELTSLSTTSFASSPPSLDIASNLYATLKTHPFVAFSAFVETRRRVAAQVCIQLKADGGNVLVLVASRDVQRVFGDHLSASTTSKGRCSLLTTGDFAELVNADDASADTTLAEYDCVILLDTHLLRLKEFIATAVRTPCKSLLAVGEVDKGTRVQLQQLSPRFAVASAKEDPTSRWANVVHQVLFVPESLKQLTLLGALQRTPPPVVITVTHKREADEVTAMLRNANIEPGFPSGVFVLLPWNPRRVNARHVINYSTPSSAVHCVLSDLVECFGFDRYERPCFMTTFVGAEDAVSKRQELAELLNDTHQNVPRFLVS